MGDLAPAISAAFVVGSAAGELYTVDWVVRGGAVPSVTGGPAGMDPSGAPFFWGWQVTAAQWSFVVFFAVLLVGSCLWVRWAWQRPSAAGWRRREGALLGLALGLVVGMTAYVTLWLGATVASDHTAASRSYHSV